MTPTWQPDLDKILTAAEVGEVRADLHRRRRSKGTRLAAAVFELAVGAGLRASEIADLTVGDMRTERDRPVVVVRQGKGGKRRSVPLLDAAALATLRAWRQERLDDGARNADSFACAISRGSEGNRLHRNAVAAKWRNAVKGLGAERIEGLSVHDGRHTFASHAVQAKGLAWTRDALGHSSIATTSIYAHALDRHAPADLY